MATNVRALLMIIRAALEHLKQTQGSVVNIGSLNAYTGDRRRHYNTVRPHGSLGYQPPAPKARLPAIQNFN